MKNKIILFVLFLTIPMFAYSNNSCTGGTQCSTQNLKNDFRIYHSDNFLFSRNDQQVAGVTASATEVEFNGSCERNYCPVRYRLSGDTGGQYRQGYIHQNGFLDRGASAAASDPDEAASVSPIENNPQPVQSADQMNNVKDDFRIYNKENFNFSRNDEQVAGVTRNAEEMMFTGPCENKYCPVKYRFTGDAEGQYREGYVHQNGFLDRGAAAQNLAAGTPIEVTDRPVVVENPPAQEDDKEEEEERPQTNPCTAALRQNACANNKREVQNSLPIRCKLEQMGGSADSIFTTWVDQNEQTGLIGGMGTISITVQEDGQYKVKTTKNGRDTIFTQGSGQICLRNGNLSLSAGEIEIALTSLNRVRHRLQTPLGNVDLDLRSTR